MDCGLVTSVEYDRLSEGFVEVTYGEKLESLVASDARWSNANGRPSRRVARLDEASRLNSEE
jgi:hypothetical protein